MLIKYAFLLKKPSTTPVKTDILTFYELKDQIS